MAIFIRGLSTGFPTGQVILTFVITYVVVLKFKSLGVLTDSTLKTLKLIKNHVYVFTTTTENQKVSVSQQFRFTSFNMVNFSWKIFQ